MSFHRRIAVAVGILATCGVLPAHAGPIDQYAVDGACSFRVHSTATGSGNDVQITVVGVAVPSAQADVPTSMIRCELYDRLGAVVVDQSQSNVGVSALAQTVDVRNAGPYLLCVTAWADWNAGPTVTEPRSCTS